MNATSFDPSAFAERARHLARRLAIATQRLDDPHVIARVARPLTIGSAAELFGLLTDRDAAVVAAAHECAMLRYAYIVAIAARAFGFDDYERDDLVQRVFYDLPNVVARSLVNGVAISNPEGWIRRRAYLIARQMLREERSTVVDVLDELADGDEEAFLHSLDGARQRERLADAIRDLGAEQPLWAEVLRLHYQAGYRLDEVAGMLRRSHGTVRNDAQKARARLAAIIRERYPDLVPDGIAGTDRKPNDAVS